MSRCFNGHIVEVPRCEGCHHVWHVVRPGEVSDGVLKPPVVKGPEDCDLCHEARHHVPQRGCLRCAGSAADAMITAIRAAQPIREEIIQLRAASWLLSWRVGVASALGLLGGGAAGGYFEGADRGERFVAWVVGAFTVPVIQFLIRRSVEHKERRLPRLGPTGEIVYGEGADDGKNAPVFLE